MPTSKGNPEKLRPFLIRLPASLYAALRKEAFRLHVPISQLVIKLIRESEQCP